MVGKRSEAERVARINELGGYHRLFSAIAAASSVWPKPKPDEAGHRGVAISVFAFVDRLDDVETQEDPSR